MAKTEVKDGANNVTITLNGDTGDVVIGGNGQRGDLVLKDELGNDKVRITAFGQITLITPDGKQRFFVGGSGGDLSLGGNGASADINLFSADAVVAVPGQPQIAPAIKLNADGGDITLRSDGKDRLRLGANSNAWLGGNGADGDLVLFAANGDNVTVDRSTIHLDGSGGNVWVGGNGADGDILILPSSAKKHDTAQATIDLGGDEGKILMRADGKSRMLLQNNGNIWLGGNGAGGDIVIFPPGQSLDGADASKASIHLDGDAGDIILRNADCAEEFDLAHAGNVEPGTVMVLDRQGQLKQSTEAYDKKVAGVISGAGDFKPGIILDRQFSQSARVPLALVGKTFCKVDAQYAPIEVGDLLTTSATAGHAMKARDGSRAFGAVIGKALRPLNEGRGLIPILIALQ